MCIRHSFPSGSSLFPFTLQPKRSAVARLPWDYRQARLSTTSSSSCVSSHLREMRDTGPATIARLLERRRPRRRRNATVASRPQGQEFEKCPSPRQNFPPDRDAPPDQSRTFWPICVHSCPSVVPPSLMSLPPPLPLAKPPRHPPVITKTVIPKKRVCSFAE